MVGAEHAATAVIPAEAVDKEPSQRGFQVLPHRQDVEHTFDWLVLHRRLVRDYEQFRIEAAPHGVTWHETANRIGWIRFLRNKKWASTAYLPSLWCTMGPLIRSVTGLEREETPGQWG
ncbi:hypothetical protein A9R04_20480 [Nocardiopsis dassonvillei]|nr:hypothetical protein A9R04_20480 [Nocardiopsis dassonvillei]